MTGLEIALAGVAAGLLAWLGLCAFVNWCQTGYFRRGAPRG